MMSVGADKSFSLKDRLTILVNSCDSYEDLWNPFFTLYKKYWPEKDVKLLLNTESKHFSFDGLQIECIHCGQKQYGARIRNALLQVKTEYVLILLDDFFLRSVVDLDRIHNIIQWMDADPDIVYFNSDCTNVYVDWEVDVYPGFRRIPPGTAYTLNLQAAIWRTSELVQFWKADVSPWEWEAFVNAKTFWETKKKFYATTDWRNAICDYGYKAEGMGVYRGKWVIDDVKPLFAKENITVDFSQRGIYDPKQDNGRTNTENRSSWYDCVVRCLGKKGLLVYFIHRLYYKLCAISGKKNVNSDFILFMQEKAQKDFLKRLGADNGKN